MIKQSFQYHSARFIIDLGLVVLFIGPILALGLYAFSTRWFFPQLLPTEWSIAPLLRQLSSPYTQAALMNSLISATVVTFLALLLGLPAARVLGLSTFPGRWLVLVVLFLPNVVPALAIGMGLNVLFLQLGLAGSMIGVVLVHLVPCLLYTSRCV